MYTSWEHIWEHLAMSPAKAYRVIEAELTGALLAGEDISPSPRHELCWEPHHLLFTEPEAFLTTQLYSCMIRGHQNWGVHQAAASTLQSPHTRQGPLCVTIEAKLFFF